MKQTVLFRIFAALLVIMLSLSCLASCGGDDADTPVIDPSKDEEGNPGDGTEESNPGDGSEENKPTLDPNSPEGLFLLPDLASPSPSDGKFSPRAKFQRLRAKNAKICKIGNVFSKNGYCISVFDVIE